MACEKRTNGSLFYLATDGSDIKKDVALENSEEFLNACREALYILFDFNEPLSDWFELQVEHFLQEFCLMASQFWRGARNFNMNRPEMMRKHWDFFDQLITFDEEDPEECEVIYHSPRPQSKRKMEASRRRQKFRNYQPPTPIR